MFSLTTMCTQTTPPRPPPQPTHTHTHSKSHYHSTLPSTILLNTIKALPLTLHCKSGLTKRRWLDPTHIQKHLIYLFISLSCMASRCIISDQGDMPTFKCYSLHLQVILSANKFKQDRIDEILRGGCVHNRLLTSTERPLSWFSTSCMDILF